MERLAGTLRPRSSATDVIQRNGTSVAVGALTNARHGPVSPAEMLARLDEDPFLHAKLDQQHRGAPARASVASAIATYLDLYGSKKPDTEDIAMVLTLIIQGVARVIAKELFDPGLESRLAARLFDLYGPDLEGATRQAPTEAGRAMGLARALSSDNPLELLMHDEISAAQAAVRIQAMATDASARGGRTVSAQDMLVLLKKRYEADLFRTFASVSRHEDKGFSGKFSVKEATGEISHDYFSRTFERDAATDLPKRDEGGLVYTAAARARLDQVFTSVRQPAPPAAAPVPRAGVTPGQEGHLAAVEGTDAGVNRGTVRAALAAWLTKWAALEPSVAQVQVATAEAALTHWPITITVPASRWFNAVPAGAATRFAPATRQERTTTEDQVLGPRGDRTRPVTHAGKYDDPNFVKERGENYLRFRSFKDAKMTGAMLRPDEMPVFGALNPDLGTSSRASASTMSYNQLSREQRAEKDQKPTAHLVFGENYYGNLTFVLKRANVAGRLVYTSSDHGRPRRDPLLALHDAISTEGSNFTRLGATAAVDQSRIALLTRVFNASAPRPQALETGSLPFEVQIFGDVDIARDVEHIYVAESVTPAQLANIRTFATGLGVPIPVTVLAPPPSLTLAKPNTVTLKGSFPAS